MIISTPVSQVSRILKTAAPKLAKLHIHTVEDLLNHLPSRYQDFSLISPIGNVQEGETVTVRGKVIEIKNQYLPRRLTLQKATVEDETGQIYISWFNQPYIVKNLPVGSQVSLAGTVTLFGSKKQLQSPEYEKYEEGEETYHTGKLIPVYPTTQGLSSKLLRKQIALLLPEVSQIPDFIPENILASYKLTPMSETLSHIHFPTNYDAAEEGRKRLAFNEVFLFYLAGLKRREMWEKSGEGLKLEVDKHQKEYEKVLQSLPFTLTASQLQSLEHIKTDISSGKAMNRLLQGDVGSGKTIVAGLSAYLAIKNGFQVLLLAPTQILATQHYNTLLNILSPFGITISLNTSNSKETRSDKADIYIGTHALLHHKLNLDQLGLVIIDEQQRFGVKQRSALKDKGQNPHLLTMTATPIPRTIALTIYGDLDVSYLSDMPKGRKIIKTWLVPNEKREAGYTWIEKEIKENTSQVFIICPFIEESENLTTVKAATKEFERLKKDVFPHLKLALLHGKQKAAEKDEILKDFKEKKYDILVATPVVEVGIDIPNATIMVIEAAERFGLSQLHQLRGRVGRGEKQSYCLLFTEATNEKTKERLASLEHIHNGSELAELDLKLRGVGDIYGTAQHGSVSFRYTNLTDTETIQHAQLAAKDIYKELSKYPHLQERVEKITQSTISPD